MSQGLRFQAVNCVAKEGGLKYGYLVYYTVNGGEEQSRKVYAYSSASARGIFESENPGALVTAILPYGGPLR